MFLPDHGDALSPMRPHSHLRTLPISLLIFPVSRMKLNEVKKRTVEPQNIEYRMSKGGFARAAQALAPLVTQSFFIE